MAKSYDEILRDQGIIGPTYDDIIENSPPPPLPGREQPSYEEIMAKQSWSPYTQARGKDLATQRAIGEGKDIVGFGRGFTEDPLEKVAAFSPIPALELADIVGSSKRLQSNSYDEMPSFSSLTTSTKMQEAKRYGAWAPTNIDAPQWTAELQKQNDAKVVGDYLIKAEAEANKHYTLGGQVGSMMSQMPKFVVEFMATGGLAKLGSAPARRAGERLMKMQAATTAGKAALAVAKKGVGLGGFAAGSALQAAGMPNRAAESILRRQVPQDMTIGPGGEVSIKGPVEGWGTSIVKGLGDHYIEIMSERMGEYMAPFVSGAFHKLPFMSKVIKGMEDRWLTKGFGKTANEFYKKLQTRTGFHGVVSEVGEEFVGDFLRGLTSVEHFGAGEDASPLERIVAGFQQDVEMLPAMVLSFAPMGLMGGGARVAAARQASHRKEVEKYFEDYVRQAFVEGYGRVPADLNMDEVIEDYKKNPSRYQDMDFMKDFLDREKVDVRRKDVFGGQAKLLTPKWDALRMLGMETPLNDVNNNFLARDRELRPLNQWIRKITKKVKKEKDLVRLPEMLPKEAQKEAFEGAVDTLPPSEVQVGDFLTKDEYIRSKGIDPNKDRYNKELTAEEIVSTPRWQASQEYELMKKEGNLPRRGQTQDVGWTPKAGATTEGGVVVSGTAEQFAELGEKQRGKPESAMLKATTHHQGVYSWLLEHVGDLTHRMTQDVNVHAGFGSVKSKIERAYNYLTHGQFGHTAEDVHEENIINNARLSKMSEQEFRDKLNELGENYSAEHAKLTVYNEVQQRARDAAIALGKQDFETAREHITWLKNLIDKGEAAWNKEALKGLTKAVTPKEVVAQISHLFPNTNVKVRMTKTKGPSIMGETISIPETLLDDPVQLVRSIAHEMAHREILMRPEGDKGMTPRTIEEFADTFMDEAERLVLGEVSDKLAGLSPETRAKLTPTPQAQPTTSAEVRDLVQADVPFETDASSFQPIGLNLDEGPRIELPTEGTKAHILQKKIGDSTSPVEIMRDLLDTYENAPSFLTESEARIFNEVRELTRNLKDRVNMVRKKLGLPLIETVEGYITHWMDQTAWRVIKAREKANQKFDTTNQLDDIPLQSGYLYHLMQGLPKNIKNPTAIHRKIKKDMESYFSKDLGKLLRTMVSYDLQDIYLTEPLTAAWEELRTMRDAGTLPESTFKYVSEYLKYDIMKMKTPLDMSVDKFLKTVLPLNTISKMLKWDRLGQDPTGSLIGGVRQLAFVNALGLRVKPAIRNLGQRMLLLDLYDGRDYLKAQAVATRMAEMPMVKHPITGKEMKLIDLIREQDWYQESLSKFEDVHNKARGVQHSAMWLYSKSHVGNMFLSNVEMATLTGYFDWARNYAESHNKNSKHFYKLVKASKKMNVPLEQLQTQKEDMMWNIREAVRRTQWEYFSISMPTIYRSQVWRGLGQFQSWWMNYFFNHTRETLNQVLTGMNSKGRLLTPYARLRALKGFGSIQAIGRVAEGLLGIEVLRFLFAPGIMPDSLPPMTAFLVSLIRLFASIGGDDKDRERAWKEVKRNFKFWIPFSVSARDLNKALSQEQDISEFIFYKKKD